MAFANNITRLCELAFREYAKSIGLANIPAASIFAGFDDETTVTPRIVFNCDQAEPDAPLDTGCWICTLEIQCTSSRDDYSPDDHHALAGEVFSQFMTGRYSVNQDITAAAWAANIGFNVDDILAGTQAKATKEREAYSSMAFQVKCFGGPIPLLGQNGMALLNQDGNPIFP